MAIVSTKNVILLYHECCYHLNCMYAVVSVIINDGIVFDSGVIADVVTAVDNVLITVCIKF